ncbi:hypothetical protein A606_03580 [Corynebacterium terpenotabidum Y-11]|uniref:DUF559 domain-containing protein n=2 Tax=Corynebacterium terpenotabidum TaxID=89154 RepID=S4XB70_9CORY|nr:hypothetical protein A606_03580 [Corynebacterium terpenotabidum Y-11]
MYRGGDLDQMMADARTTAEHLRAAPPTRVRPGVDDREDSGYVEVNGLWVPSSSLRVDEDADRGARHHPRRLRYALDALTRARILGQRQRGWTLSCWSAASEWGLPWFCDDADTCAIAPVTPRTARDANDCTVRRRTPALAAVDPVQIDPRCPDLRVTPPVLTLVHCLQSVWRGGHSWYAVPGTGLTDRGLRAVQIVDAFCTLFNVAPSALLDACRDQFNASALKRILAVADQGTDSPMETVMRLKVLRILRVLVARGALTSIPVVTPQLVVHADGSVSDPVHGGATGTARIIARLDLGIGEFRLALQYDGSGHLTKDRRDRDSQVTAALANLGWHPLRLTYGHLIDDDLLWRTVADGVKLCLSRL